MADLTRALMELKVGEVRSAEPMARHTSFRLGGPARAMVWPRGPAEAAALVDWLKSREPFFVLGRGSNLLVADQGYDGVVVNLRKLPATLQPAGAGLVVVSASFPAARLAREVRRFGLVGLEFLAGIPGSIGGAVAMNAGAHGSELGDFVQEAWVTDGSPVASLVHSQLGFGYRQSIFPAAGLLLSVSLRLPTGDTSAAADLERSYLERRRASQPWRWPSAGSVFRNPPGQAAGRLIEGVGGKGRRQGGAEISTVHANFIVNRGGARAAEVLSLLRWAREAVEREYGIQMIPEIRLLGFAAPDLDWLPEVRL